MTEIEGERGLRPETVLVHAGRPGWPRDEAPSSPASARWPGGVPTSPPIHPSSAFWHEEASALDAAFAGAPNAYSYSRHGNPTVADLETALARVEGTEAAVAYPSGMAAIHGALFAAGLRPGDTLLLSRDVYGATLTLARSLLSELGIRVELADVTRGDETIATLERLRPRAFLFETVSNPLLRVADGPALVRAARAAGTRTIVDNTFATPLGCRPAEWGADFVVHSTTKFIAGHGDVTGGVVCCSSPDRERLVALNKLVGAVPSPFDAWLALRGLRTLAVRVERQTANAQALAAWLAGHARVERVHYPGLASHPDHETARRVLATPGAMVSADLAGGRAAVTALLERCRIWVPATTLGDCTSLLLYPAMSSHRSLTPEERRAIGIGDGLVRFSVGLEDVEDLKRDLDRALAGA